MGNASWTPSRRHRRNSRSSPTTAPLPAAFCAVRAVAAPERATAAKVNDVGLKDAPLKSLFPEEPKPPAPVRWGCVAGCGLAAFFGCWGSGPCEPLDPA